MVKSKYEKKKCNECKKRKPLYESRQTCRHCYKMKATFKPSGNKVIDDFIRYTQTNYVVKKEGKMEFVPYNEFEVIKFIAKGGFSEVYKAKWARGPVKNYKIKYPTRGNNSSAVVLKKLDNSKNITSKELNEVCLLLY